MPHTTLNDLLTSWNIDSQQLQQQQNIFEILTARSIKKNNLFYIGLAATLFYLSMFSTMQAAHITHISFSRTILFMVFSNIIIAIGSAALFGPIIHIFIQPYGTKDNDLAKHINIENQKTIYIHRPTFKALYEQYRTNLALIRSTYTRNPTKYPELLTILNKYHDTEITLDNLLNGNINAILNRLNNQPQYIQLQSFVESYPEILHQTA